MSTGLAVRGAVCRDLSHNSFRRPGERRDPYAVCSRLSSGSSCLPLQISARGDGSRRSPGRRRWWGGCLDQTPASRNLICLSAQARTGEAALRQSSPTGKSPKTRQALFVSVLQKLKLIPVNISSMFRASRSNQRGGSRSSRNAGRDAVDADAPITNGADADGEVVWS